MEYESEVVGELTALAPEAVPDFETATQALDAEDYAGADTLFARVLTRAPDFDVALRRRAYCLNALGSYTEAVRLGREALAQRRTPENLTGLAVLLGTSVGGRGPTPAGQQEALNLVLEARKGGDNDLQRLLLQAHLALSEQNFGAFREASEALSRDHDDQMPTHYYAAIRLAGQEQWGPAEREIRRAGELGLPPEAVEEFMAGTGLEHRARIRRWAGYGGIATGLWIAGMILLFVVGRVLSVVTLRSLERDDPNREVSGAPKRLRSVYRGVITVAGVYYYLSLPFVALLILVLTGGAFYAFLSAGYIPIKLAAILGIGALATVYAIVGSLFVRVRDADPGRALPEEEAPELWRIAREVAAEVGTRPVDEIWMTPGTELAVFERGDLRDRMRDRGRRALLLGVGVLDDFDQDAFKAVLAHEYGHFTHRDTAGGDVALRVNNGMIAFARSLAQSGFAVWWNLGFHFLRVYDRLFRRITHGATRLQEVLADRVAVQRYGMESFRKGLSHVVRRSILFDHHANGEIRRALEAKRPLADLYRVIEPVDASEKKELEEAIRDAMERPTSEYDTHPSPAHRFRLASRLTGGGSSKDAPPVWDLFRDPAALKEEMRVAVERRVQAYARAAEAAG